MQTSCQTNHRSCTYRPALCLSILLVCSIFTFPSFAEQKTNTSPQVENKAPGIEDQVVSLIQRGQWDAADALLQKQTDDVKKKQKDLLEILQQYRQLRKSRREKQQELYSVRNERLEMLIEKFSANDPNVIEQDLLNQLNNVWKDATDAQKEELAGRQSVQRLMDTALQSAEKYYSRGDWKKSYSTGVRWLMTFEPENPVYQEMDEKYREAVTVDAMLKKSPCDDFNDRYARIERQSVRQVFDILQTRYAKPIVFHQMAQKMLTRCIVLGDILKTAPTDVAIEADPNDIERWVARTDRLSGEFGKKDTSELARQDFEDLLDALIVQNKDTLKLPEGLMLSMLTHVALAELDPYTAVVWPSEVKNFDKAMTGQFGGVGIQINKVKEGLKVVSLLPDTPAIKAGLRADALILEVDGESTKKMNMQCAIKNISGPIGTSVILTVRYPDSKKTELVTVVRGKIVVPVVEGSSQADNGKTQGHWDYFLDEKGQVGYLRLKNFTGRTVSQVKAALKTMESEGLAGLILDVRGNGGGLLDAAVNLSDLFISNGLLLKSKGRDNLSNQWAAKEDSPKRLYPIVVLIDNASASASEIVAGILGCDAYQRAVLIGQQTYGKGSVQEVVELGAGKGKLKFTSAYYYLPDGEPVKNRDVLKRNGRNDWGIMPDILIPLYDFERRQIRKVNAKRTKISNTASQEQVLEETSIRDQMLSADPQLKVALLVLKAAITTSR